MSHPFWAIGLRPEHLAEPAISEIRKADDGQPADANDFIENSLGIGDALQGLGKDNHVELMMSESGEGFPDVDGATSRPRCKQEMMALGSSSTPMRRPPPAPESRDSSSPLPQPRSKTLLPSGMRPRMAK